MAFSLRASAAGMLTAPVRIRTPGTYRRPALTTLSSEPSLKAAIEHAASKADPHPSPEQKAAGNFRKGHVTVQGLPVTIENAAGSVRCGVAKNGQAWSVVMKNHYGYVKRTASEADGDHIDVFLGPRPESEVVFVIDQNKADGNFDEHKCMLGWTNCEDAKKAYHDNYSKGWTGFRGIRALTMDQFRDWIQNGDTSRPICDQQLTTLSADPKAVAVLAGGGRLKPEPVDQQTGEPVDQKPASSEQVEAKRTEAGQADDSQHALFAAYLDALIRAMESADPEEKDRADEEADRLWSMLHGEDEQITTLASDPLGESGSSESGAGFGSGGGRKSTGPWKEYNGPYGGWGAQHSETRDIRRGVSHHTLNALHERRQTRQRAQATPDNPYPAWMVKGEHLTPELKADIDRRRARIGMAPPGETYDAAKHGPGKPGEPPQQVKVPPPQARLLPDPNVEHPHVSRVHEHFARTHEDKSDEQIGHELGKIVSHYPPESATAIASRYGLGRGDSLGSIGQKIRRAIKPVEPPPLPQRQQQAQQGGIPDDVREVHERIMRSLPPEEQVRRSQQIIREKYGVSDGQESPRESSQPQHEPLPSLITKLSQHRDVKKGGYDKILGMMPEQQVRDMAHQLGFGPKFTPNKPEAAPQAATNPPQQQPAPGGAASGPSIPPPKPGTVRMYHGGHHDTTSGGGRWVSASQDYAEGYARKSGGQLHYVDVPLSHPVISSALDEVEWSTGRRDPQHISNMELPPELSSGLKPHPGWASPEPPQQPAPGGAASGPSTPTEHFRTKTPAKLVMPGTHVRGDITVPQHSAGQPLTRPLPAKPQASQPEPVQLEPTDEPATLEHRDGRWSPPAAKQTAEAPKPQEVQAPSPAPAEHPPHIVKAAQLKFLNEHGYKSGKEVPHGLRASLQAKWDANHHKYLPQQQAPQQPAQRQADDPLAALRGAAPEREPGDDDSDPLEQGQTVGIKAFKGPEPVRSYGHEHRHLRNQAQQAGHPVDDIQQMADDMAKQHNDFAQERNEMLSRAREQALAGRQSREDHGNYTSLTRRGEDSLPGGAEDAAGIKGFDNIVASAVAAYPHHFRPVSGEHGDHADQLHTMLTGGSLPLMTPAQAFQAAWQKWQEMKEEEEYRRMAEEREGKQQPKQSASIDDDFIPFSTDWECEADLLFVLSTIPESVDYIAFMNNDGWVRYGPGPRGGMGWRNTATGRVVYTKSETAPGYRRRQQQASHQRATELGNRHAAHLKGEAGSKPLTEAELRELATHAQVLPVHSLKNLQSLTMATWGKAGHRRHMVEALSNHVQSLVHKARVPGSMVAQAAPAMRQPGLFDDVEEQASSTPAETAKHPVEKYESWDFSHPEDRDYLARVHDKYAHMSPDEMRSAADRAYDLSKWWKHRGLNQRRYLSSAHLLNEMSEAQGWQPSSVKEYEARKAQEQPVAKATTESSAERPAEPAAPTQAAAPQATAEPQAEVVKPSIHGGTIASDEATRREHQDLGAEADAKGKPGFAETALGRGSLPNPVPNSDVIKTTQDLLQPTDWQSLNVGQYRHGGSVPPEHASKLADTYAGLPDRDKTLFAEQFGIENAARALPETRDDLVSRKIHELTFKHDREPELQKGGGLFGERGVGESRGLFDGAEGSGHNEDTTPDTSGQEPTSGAANWKLGHQEGSASVLERIKNSPNQPKDRNWDAYASQFGVDDQFHHVELPAELLKSHLGTHHLRGNSTNQEVVDQKVQSGDRNPVIISQEPGRGSLIVDGTHSLHAAIKAGDKSVKAIVGSRSPFASHGQEPAAKSQPESQVAPEPETKRPSESTSADVLYHPDGKETEHPAPGSPEHLGKQFYDAVTMLHSDDEQQEAEGARRMDELMEKINALPHDQKKQAMKHAAPDYQVKRKRSPNGERQQRVSEKPAEKKEGYTPLADVSDEEYERMLEENKARGRAGVEKMAQAEAGEKAKETASKPAEPAGDPHADLIRRLSAGYLAQMAERPGDKERAAEKDFVPAMEEFNKLPEEDKKRVHLAAFKQEYKPKKKAGPTFDDLAARGKKMIDDAVKADLSQKDIDDYLEGVRGLEHTDVFGLTQRFGMHEARHTEPKSALVKRIQDELVASSRSRARAQV